MKESGRKTGDVVRAIKAKKDGAIVFFESGNKIPLSLSAYTDFRLYEGKEVTPAELKDLREYSKSDIYYQSALRLLSRDNYSSHDLKQKLLSKGADPKTAGKIVVRLSEQGLLDDALYAKTYAQDVAAFRLYGKNRIIFKLRSSGIPDHILQSLEFPEEEELSKALSFAKTLDIKYKAQPDSKKFAKATLALRERGFAPEIAEQAVALSLSHNDHEEEVKALNKDYLATAAKLGRKYEGYALSRRIFAVLSRKGYAYEDIINVMEVNKDDDIRD